MYEKVVIASVGSVGSHTIQTIANECDVPSVHIHPLHKIKQEIDNKTLIVVGFRDPIARNLSFFLQCMYNNIPKFEDDLDRNYYVDHIHQIKHIPPTELFLRFKGKNFTDMPMQWMERFLTMFKLDGTSLQQPYTLIKHQDCDIFFYKLEYMNVVVPTIYKLLGSEAHASIHTNHHSKKWYSEIRTKFMPIAKFTNEEMFEYYSHPIVKQFYTDTEINKFKKDHAGR